MATDALPQPDRSGVTVVDLVAFTKKELEADAERQGRISAAGDIPKESHTGITLDLSHKKIQLLPPEVIALIRDRVERLALSHNPSISLPAQLVQCDRLRYLNLRWNQLTEIPQPVLQLSKLEILDISKNKVTVIPDDIKNLTSLKFLAVARNQITRLPTALGEMASLSKLKFDDNPLEYPPAEVLQPQPTGTLNSEREKEVCQQVKRYLKAAAMREKLRTNSSEDLSESNVETPRPPKRTVTGGRFPVRPSVSGIDNVDDLKGKSPNQEPAPPIPLKSHARVASGHSSTKRPSNSPSSNAGSDSARTRSDTVSSSASVRSRRQGFVPRKANDLGSVSELASRSASQSPFGRAVHSRASSSISTLNGFLAAGSGNESSSGAVSPIDGPYAHPRYRATPRLSSLPESRHSRVKISQPYKACRRLMFILFDLGRPLAPVIASLKDSTPRKTALERQMATAGAIVQELGRLATRLDSGLEDGTGEERAALTSIFTTSVSALKAYGSILRELRQTTQKLLLATDVFLVRALMNQFYYTMVEFRNICTLLGFECRAPPVKDTPRQPSQAWSSRTVTPTQPTKPINTKRLRGATILQSMNNGATLRVVPPPVPLNGSTSRSNTMSSQSSAATPRAGETPTSAPQNSMAARHTPIRVVTDDHDVDEQFERIFLKLRGACDMIAQALPSCRREFVARKEHANANGQTTAPHYWSVVITRCDTVLGAQSSLLNRLKVVRLNDPGVRYQKDFWQMCDGLVKAWADFMISVQDLAGKRLELTTIKTILRPVQKMMKDTSKMISESSLYHQASRPSALNSAAPGLAPAFSAGMHSPYAYGSQSGSHSGYVTPVPATPLSAALGPAVQATQAFSNLQNPDHSYSGPHGLGVRAAHERVDTVMQPTQGRRLP